MGACFSNIVSPVAQKVPPGLVSVKPLILFVLTRQHALQLLRFPHYGVCYDGLPASFFNGRRRVPLFYLPILRWLPLCCTSANGWAMFGGCAVSRMRITPILRQDSWGDYRGTRGPTTRMQEPLW